MIDLASVTSLFEALNATRNYDLGIMFGLIAGIILALIWAHAFRV
ncbi:hypothetical protein FACS1894202_14240 [Clostridia bacterium]|nr:hypothetical protein FACS1894202_14240 [Clostridia bacterium]